MKPVAAVVTLVTLGAALSSGVACSRAGSVAASGLDEERPGAASGTSGSIATPAPGGAPLATPRTSGAAANGETTVRYWVAGCSAPEDLWKYRKSSTVFCDARGRTLESAGGTMRWPDYLDAGDLDTLQVEGEDLAGLEFSLAWSADDNFRSSSSVQQTSTSSASTVRFELAGAPEWRGTIRRFRLTWRGQPSHASRIVAAWGRKRH